MSCRHSDGDPNCTSGKSPTDLAKRARADYTRWCVTAGPVNTWESTIPSSSLSTISTYSTTQDAPPTTPDSERYEILDVVETPKHMILKVLYPNCASCSYEGTKILVLEGVSAKNAIKWKQIDPHFRDPSRLLTVREAPAPVARFPGSDSGWADAIMFVSMREARDRGVSIHARHQMLVP